MDSAGMRLECDKCQFTLSQVHYLGHTVSSQGIQPTQEKVQAIRNVPAATNIHQLKSSLGLLNFYAKFLKNLSTTLAPMYTFLQKNRPWSWGTDQQRAFQHTKQKLVLSSLLVHYCEQRDLLLATVASPYGVGAVLLHRMEDGSDKLTAYA